jgi:PAS domain S-box-containing protein
MRPSLAYLLRVAALAAVYYVAARIGLSYASIGHSVSLVWPPTGVALAALIALGYRFWPGVALGAFLANASTPVPLTVAAGIAVGNTLEALVAAYLVRRVAGARPRLDNMRTVRALVLGAAPLGALVSASIGVTTLWASGELPGPTLGSAFALWWSGDVLGALVVAPLLLVWGPAAYTRTGARGPLEIALLCLGTVVAAELGLGQLFGFSILRQVDYLYLLFPFVIWASLRFGSRGASLMTLTVSAVAVWHTTRGAGPFVAGTAAETLFAAACYLAVVAVTGLLLAAAVAHERESATEALRHREDQLRVALDAARMGIWSWSAEENRLSWDNTMCRLYGLSPGERVTTYEDFLNRVHPDDREFVDATVQRALAAGGRLDYEFRILLPDGRIHWIADQGRVLPGAPGSRAGMTGVCMDVTERRLAEEHLRQAHRMESVGRLAGGVAHESNNQMSVVIGATDFILRRPDIPEGIRVDVEHIRRAADRTAAVTAQLLAFSRRQVLKPQVLDLNDLVRRFETVLQRVMGEDCTVSLRLASGVVRVKADPGQLEQVLLNLAINARDAMPRGGVLTLETLSTEITGISAEFPPGVVIRAGHYALLLVSDTGHGMDRVILGHIFEPFFTTKGVGQGTGLGLSTVYGIVKQSDGYVWATSEPGSGTTFKIYLPLTAEEVAAPRPSGTVRVAARGELILVVEDEEMVRRIAGRALMDAGYRVWEAESARQALDLLAEAHEPCKLVLVDVVMPGMGGRELASKIGELRPGIPTLFISGYTDDEIVRRGLLEPDAAFLPKPFTTEALVRAVRDRLEGHAPAHVGG